MQPPLFNKCPEVQQLLCPALSPMFHTYTVKLNILRTIQLVKAILNSKLYARQINKVTNLLMKKMYISVLMILCVRACAGFVVCLCFPAIQFLSFTLLAPLSSSASAAGT